MWFSGARQRASYGLAQADGARGAPIERQPIKRRNKLRPASEGGRGRYAQSLCARLAIVAVVCVCCASSLAAAAAATATAAATPPCGGLSRGVGAGADSIGESLVRESPETLLRVAESCSGRGGGGDNDDDGGVRNFGPQPASCCCCDRRAASRTGARRGVGGERVGRARRGSPSDLAARAARVGKRLAPEAEVAAKLVGVGAGLERARARVAAAEAQVETEAGARVEVAVAEAASEEEEEEEEEEDVESEGRQIGPTLSSASPSSSWAPIESQRRSPSNFRRAARRRRAARVRPSRRCKRHTSGGRSRTTGAPPPPLLTGPSERRVELESEGPRDEPIGAAPFNVNGRGASDRSAAAAASGGSASGGGGGVGLDELGDAQLVELLAEFYAFLQRPVAAAAVRRVGATEQRRWWRARAQMMRSGDDALAAAAIAVAATTGAPVDSASAAPAHLPAATPSGGGGGGAAEHTGALNFGSTTADESLLLLGWLKNKQSKYTSLKNITFELIDERPNRLINVCLDGPKILILPNVSDIIYCYTRDQWIDKLWSEAMRLSTFHYPIIVLNMLIFLFGTIGNIFVCLSVKRNYQLRSVTNYFIVNLALADLLVILICLPATVVWDLSLTWFFDTVPCKLIMFLQDVSISVSVLTLTAISIDRYYAICYPLKFKSSLSQAKKVIALIWLVSLIIMSPDLIYLSAHRSADLTEAGLDTVLYSDCNYDWSEQSSRAFQFVKTILLYLLPFLLMFCAHYRILKVLNLASTMVAASSQQQLGVATEPVGDADSSAAYELRALGASDANGVAGRRPQPKVRLKSIMSEGAATTAAAAAAAVAAAAEPSETDASERLEAAAAAATPARSVLGPARRPQSRRALAVAAMALARASRRMRPLRSPDVSAAAAAAATSARSSAPMSADASAGKDKQAANGAVGKRCATFNSAPAPINNSNSTVDADCSTVVVELSSMVGAPLNGAPADDHYLDEDDHDDDEDVGDGCNCDRDSGGALRPQTEIWPPTAARQVRFVDERPQEEDAPTLKEPPRVTIRLSSGRGQCPAGQVKGPTPTPTPPTADDGERQMVDESDDSGDVDAQLARNLRLGSDLSIASADVEPRRVSPSRLGRQSGPRPLAAGAGAQVHLAAQAANACRRPSEFMTLTMHNRSKLESRRKAAKMLTAIVILFGICYLPVHLINFLRQFISDIPQTDVTSSLSMLAHCVCYLNSAINPIIYNHMNSVFRQEFKRSLECCLNWGLACRRWKCCAAFERRWPWNRAPASPETSATPAPPRSASSGGGGGLRLEGACEQPATRAPRTRPGGRGSVQGGPASARPAHSEPSPRAAPERAPNCAIRCASTTAEPEAEVATATTTTDAAEAVPAPPPPTDQQRRC